MKKPHAPQASAFTVIELLVVIAVLAILVILQFPALANTQSKVQRVNCSGNLKQVGIAFRTWAQSHNGLMPMAYPASQRGASTAVGTLANTYSDTAFAANYPPSGPRGVFGMFVVMSNELVTPKILYCPSEFDPNIRQAAIFGNSTMSNFVFNLGFNSDSFSSYFVGVDANENAPSMMLAGDHNLGSGANQAVRLSQFISAGTNSFWPATAIGWQDNQHQQKGNVAFADGSVQSLTTPQFRDMLNKTGDQGRSSIGPFSLAPGSVGAGVNRLQFPRI